jgi:predicted small secreted protein
MKKQYLTLVFLTLLSICASGCANTARGAKQDIKNADENIEKATH